MIWFGITQDERGGINGSDHDWFYKPHKLDEAGYLVHLNSFNIHCIDSQVGTYRMLQMVLVNFTDHLGFSIFFASWARFFVDMGPDGGPERRNNIMITMTFRRKNMGHPGIRGIRGKFPMGNPKSSSHDDHDLVLKPMVTYGDEWGSTMTWESPIWTMENDPFTDEKFPAK